MTPLVQKTELSRTREAEQVLESAQEEVAYLSHSYIGTEHLLLGLLRNTEDLPAFVLANMGARLPKVRSAVTFIIGRGEAEVENPGLTPRSQKVLAMAEDEARLLQHSQVNSIDILLALALEGEGIAAGVLESLGLDLDKLRLQALEALEGPQTKAKLKKKNTLRQVVQKLNPYELLLADNVPGSLIPLLDSHLLWAEQTLATALRPPEALEIVRCYVRIALKPFRKQYGHPTCFPISRLHDIAVGKVRDPYVPRCPYCSSVLLGLQEAHESPPGKHAVRAVA